MIRLWMFQTEERRDREDLTGRKWQLQTWFKRRRHVGNPRAGRENGPNGVRDVSISIMGNTADFAVRNASPQDVEAVNALLQASYPSLMALGYEPVLFARALPLLTKANPALLSSGTWYVVEVPGADGTLVGCGGWARQRPDAPNEPVDPVLGHIRHFATHPNWTRRGIGRALFDRCVADARAAGVCTFECYSSIVAEAFYLALGFRTVESMKIALGENLTMPSVRMLCQIAQPST
jgi:N-acetylglutamate synthase-like GNAT family acetyltransferase